MQIKNYIFLLRPKHWIKNSFIFAPVIFAKQINLLNIKISLLAFAAFSLIASAIYIINDIADIEEDKKHPRKSKRPLPAGKIAIKKAIFFDIFLIIFSITIGFLVNKNIVIILSIYFMLNILYTFKFKHIAILDAFCIALGFVLRVLAGAVALQVNTSGWIITTTFFLALFLGFGKRRNELLLIENGNKSKSPRKVLDQYNLDMLNQIIISTGTISIIAYALYTLDQSVIKRFGNDKLFYTTIFVAFGIYRYIYQLFKNSEGDPTEILTSDKSIILVTLLWAIAILLLIFNIV